MKAKFYLIAAAACAALAACSKNEVVSTAPDQQITFQAVVNKASTKALINSTNYPLDETFGTYAYYYTGTYPDASKKYIVNTKVKNIDGSTSSGLAWTTDTPYYWPKNGKLAFYSYSPFDELNSVVNCDTSDGIKISNWDVDAKQDVDVMVADFIDEQTLNESNAGYTGVPTVFRHKLAQVVKFNIKTDKDYTTGTKDLPAAGDKFFFLNEIKIGKIAYKGTFTSGQKPSSYNVGSWAKTEDRISTPYTWYSESAENETEFDSLGKDSPCDLTGNYLLVLPQEMTAISGSQTAEDVEHIVLKYTIRTFWGTGAYDYTDEAVVQTVDLKTITDSWVINKKYTYDITVSLDKIYWAPSVINWETETDTIGF